MTEPRTQRSSAVAAHRARTVGPTAQAARVASARRLRLQRREHPGPRGPGGGPPAPRHVHRLDRRARPAPPRLGDRRQLGRRGDGRPRDHDHGHDRRRRHGRGRATTAAASRSASTRRARTPSRSSRRSSTPAASSAAAATRCRAACTASASASSTRCRSGCASRSARDGSVWAQEYERGKPTRPGQEGRPAGRPARHDERCFLADPRSSRPPTTRSRRSPSASARRPT